VAATALLTLGVTAIATGMTLGARSGNAAIVARLGPAADLAGWEQLTALVLQVTAAASVLAFGVVLSWCVGREFADGTVTGLFALPVSRPALVSAKLIVYLLWTVGVGLVLVAAVAVVGTALGLEPPPAVSVPTLLSRIPVLVVLSALIAVPAAWAATVARGLLAGIASTVAIIAVAQIMAVSGVGAWVPVTAPALWALDIDAVTPLQLGLVGTVPLLFGGLTLRSWATLQLDR
jgi:ABC-2 type transport system permease protein